MSLGEIPTSEAVTISPQVLSKVARVSQLIGGLVPEGFNPHFKGSFITKDQIVVELKRIMFDQNFYVAMIPAGDVGNYMVMLLDQATDTVDLVPYVLPRAKDMQAKGAMETYALRQYYGLLFNIPGVGFDDDGETLRKMMPADENTLKLFVKAWAVRTSQTGDKIAEDLESKNHPRWDAYGPTQGFESYQDITGEWFESWRKKYNL